MLDELMTGRLSILMLNLLLGSRLLVPRLFRFVERDAFYVLLFPLFSDLALLESSVAVWWKRRSADVVIRTARTRSMRSGLRGGEGMGLLLMKKMRIWTRTIMIRRRRKVWMLRNGRWRGQGRLLSEEGKTLRSHARGSVSLFLPILSQWTRTMMRRKKKTTRWTRMCHRMFRSRRRSTRRNAHPQRLNRPGLRQHRSLPCVLFLALPIISQFIPRQSLPSRMPKSASMQAESNGSLRRTVTSIASTRYAYQLLSSACLVTRHTQTHAERRAN